jgi:alanine racemase
MQPTRTWAEVSLTTIACNARALQRRAGEDVFVVGVVKANAYGHGLVPVARAVADAGLPWLAVATVDEARSLRDAGLTLPLLVLAPLLDEEAAVCAALSLTPLVSSRSFFAAGQRLSQPPRCALALDTGMGREGLCPDEAAALLDEAVPGTIVGVATHYSSADEDDVAPTDSQTARFAEFVAAHRMALRGCWLSLANSPGLLRASLPETLRAWPIQCRPGALLYGIEPYAGALDGTDLAPALIWKARLTLVRSLPAGATIGYGRTHSLTRPSRIATLAVGYADGLSRHLSNRGFVLIRGTRCPIVGRISMDQCQVDVTEAPEAVAGDTAVLLGKEGGHELTALEMARGANTTSHEPTTLLSARVTRHYL